MYHICTADCCLFVLSLRVCSVADLRVVVVVRLVCASRCRCAVRLGGAFEIVPF